MPARPWTAAVAVLLLVPVFAASASGAELPRLVFTPDQPTESDFLSVTVLGSTDVACGAFFFAVPDPAARRIELRGISVDPPEPCAEGSWTFQAALETGLPAGTYTIEATLDQHPYAAAQLTVGPAPTQLVLGTFEYFGSNFRLELLVRDPRTHQVRPAGGRVHSRQAAQFWFFDPANPEVTVKVLDGTPVNDHFWLFLSSMTTVEFTLRIRHCIEGDPPFCSEVKEYHSPAGANQDLVDVEAF
jgi:hypothetical protein